MSLCRVARAGGSCGVCAGGSCGVCAGDTVVDPDGVFQGVCACVRVSQLHM